MKLQDAEREALYNSAILLKFAAESPKTVPNEVVLPLLAGWDAAEKNQWSPAIATEFWIAYSKLSDLIKPVTVDTISMCQVPEATGRTNWWANWRAKSKAQSQARWYLLILVSLVALSVFFGFIAERTTKLDQEIEGLITKGDELAPQISILLPEIDGDLAALNLGIDSLKLDLDDKRIPKEIKNKINTLRAELQRLYWVSDQIWSNVHAISKITPFKSMEPYPVDGAVVPDGYPMGPLSRLPVLDHGFNNVRDYYKTRRNVRNKRQELALLNGIINALVPILLGAVGAATYVVRQTSEEIKNSTFASSSPTRHFMRITLGILAGLIIGLGVFNNELNLSSAALSFLAGYSIEPVFSSFDSIAEKFNRT